MNVSLIRYLNSRRIEKAFFALTNGTEPVKLIAAQLGFDDPLVFARLFKRHVGMTPAEYRKKQNSPGASSINSPAKVLFGKVLTVPGS